MIETYEKTSAASDQNERKIKWILKRNRFYRTEFWLILLVNFIEINKTEYLMSNVFVIC